MENALSMKNVAMQKYLLRIKSIYENNNNKYLQILTNIRLISQATGTYFMLQYSQ